MSDDAIYLVPYDEKWPDVAAKEIAAIRALLPNVDFKIEHIGSMCSECSKIQRRLA